MSRSQLFPFALLLITSGCGDNSVTSPEGDSAPPPLCNADTQSLDVFHLVQPGTGGPDFATTPDDQGFAAVWVAGGKIMLGRWLSDGTPNGANAFVANVTLAGGDVGTHALAIGFSASGKYFVAWSDSSRAAHLRVVDAAGAGGAAITLESPSAQFDTMLAPSIRASDNGVAVAWTRTYASFQNTSGAFDVFTNDGQLRNAQSIALPEGTLAGSSSALAGDTVKVAYYKNGASIYDYVAVVGTALLGAALVPTPIAFPQPSGDIARTSPVLLDDGQNMVFVDVATSSGSSPVKRIEVAWLDESAAVQATQFIDVTGEMDRVEARLDQGKVHVLWFEGSGSVGVIDSPTLHYRRLTTTTTEQSIDAALPLGINGYFNTSLGTMNGATLEQDGILTTFVWEDTNTNYVRTDHVGVQFLCLPSHTN